MFPYHARASIRTVNSNPDLLKKKMVLFKTVTKLQGYAKVYVEWLMCLNGRD